MTVFSVFVFSLVSMFSSPIQTMCFLFFTAVFLVRFLEKLVAISQWLSFFWFFWMDTFSFCFRCFPKEKVAINNCPPGWTQLNCNCFIYQAGERTFADAQVWKAIVAMQFPTSLLTLQLVIHLSVDLNWRYFANFPVSLKEWNQLFTLFDHQNVCNSLGGNLATVLDPLVNIFVQGLIEDDNADAWIGYNDIAEVNLWAEVVIEGCHLCTTVRLKYSLTKDDENIWSIVIKQVDSLCKP